MSVSVHDKGVGGPDSSHEFDSADELISDLAALLDAGLVVIHEHVLGPARYGVAPVPGRRTEDESRATRSYVAIMQG